MLVLGVDLDDRIVLHRDGAILAIVEVKRGRATLGFSADRSVKIDRLAIFRKKYPEVRIP